MPYVVKSTERTRSGASDNETSSLLYLMNFYRNKDQVHYFVVDLFNDLTGVSKNFDKAYDLQSKKSRSNSEDIGKELVTLYKNFVSDLYFSDYILFLGSIKNNILAKDGLYEFKYSDFKDEEKIKLKNSLIKECNDKTYINSKDIDEKRINNFLDKVSFVINKRSKVEYIKSIVEVKKALIDDKVFEDIFNSIKKLQSSKKEEKVEGLILNDIREFIPLKRHITKNDIKQYILNIILNYDWCSRKTIPTCLTDAFGLLTSDQCRDLQDNFLNRMALTLYDANNNKNFWKLFSEIYYIVKDLKIAKPIEIFDKLNADAINKNKHLDKNSILFFICIFIEGILYENN